MDLGLQGHRGLCVMIVTLSQTHRCKPSLALQTNPSKSSDTCIFFLHDNWPWYLMGTSQEEAALWQLRENQGKISSVPPISSLSSMEPVMNYLVLCISWLVKTKTK